MPSHSTLQLRRDLHCAVLFICACLLTACASTMRGQAVTVTNVFQDHYHYGYPIGNQDCPSGYNIPSGQYPSAYHLERGHAIHHLDPVTAANDYWVYWAHFDSSSYTVAEVVIFKSTSECGPYVLQTGLSPTYNTDGGGYGFQPGGWQSRDEIIFRDAATQTYNADGTVANYASSYLVTATDSLGTQTSSSGSTCSYANDSDAVFKMTPDYLGIDSTTKPSTNGANFVFICDQREAPVLMRAGNDYFLVVSQAAGYYPSQGGYGVSSNPLTGWTPDPINLGNTSTFGGQTSDGFTIAGTQANAYVLSFDHLGGTAGNYTATGEETDTGGMLLPLILDGTAGTATLNWEPSWTVDNTTGVLTLPTLTNLTKGTPGATASSTVLTAATSGTTTYVPGNAIDGIYTTRWNGSLSGSTAFSNLTAPVNDTNNGSTTTLCPITGATATTKCNPSIVVDLKSVQAIQELDLSFYMVKGSEPYYTYKVAYSSDNVTWTTNDYTAYAAGNNAIASNIGIVPFSNNLSYGFNALPVNFSARYVALIETGVYQQNSNSPFYGPNAYEMAVIASTAPAVPATAVVTVTPSSTTPPTDSSFTVGVTVAGSGATPTGYIQLSAPGYVSEIYGLVNGANSYTIPAGATSGGSGAITVSYRADPTSVPVYGTGTFTGTANISVSTPDAPVGLTATASEPNVLTETWTASTGASSYVLYRSTDGGNTYTQLAAPTTTNYMDTGLTNGSTYCYKVAAVNGGGTGTASTPVCASPTANFPVTGITVNQNGSTQLTVTYSATGGASSYNIDVSASGGAYTLLTNTAALTYTETGLSNGVNYCYTIQAVFGTGNGAPSSPVCTTVSASIATVTINDFSFESPVTSSYVYDPAINGTTQPWTFTASGAAIGSGVTTNGSGFTASNSAAPAGTQVAFVQGLGVVYQTISGLTIGTTYRVIESASQRANKGGGQIGNPFEVRVDGTAIATVMATQGTTSYTDFTQYFTATKTSHVFGFYGTNANANTTYPDNTVLVDNVRMITAPGNASTSSTANFVWLVNNTGTILRTDEQGTVQNSALGSTNSGSTYGGVAIDSGGGVWSVSSGNNLINYIPTATAANSGTYTATTFTDASLNAPSSVAIDGAGTVWVTNSGNTAVSAFTAKGALSGTTSDSSLQGASGIAIDQAGNVWVANAAGNTVDEILGGAAPTPPLATAATANAPGTKP